MTKIFIPLAVQNPKGTIVPNHFVRETYLAKIIKENLTPVLVPVLTPMEIAEKMYEECAGVLFTGGGDIDPRHYGEALNAQTHIDDPRRDEFEIVFAKRAVKDRKPFLGICRGCQILAIANGGSLHQHVPDLVKNENHGVSEGGTYDNLLDQKNGHRVIIDSQSKAFMVVQQKEFEVNSGHHQAVNNPGHNMNISARSSEGIIEIIEHEDPKYFCFGVQSHPECCGTDFPGEREDIGLGLFFKKFAEAVHP